MRYLSLLILFFACVHTNAQIVPGYQGKKGIISYQVSISPAIDRPTFLNKVSDNSSYPKADESMFFPFNFTHGLIFERVLGRKFALAFDYHFVATKDYINFSQKVRDDVSGIDQTFQFNNAQINIFGHYFVGSMVFYGNRSLAPFGKYFKISVGHVETFSSFTQDTYSTTPTSQTSPSTIYTFSTKDVHYSLPTSNIGFSFGMNRIYHNRLIISRGVNFSLLLNPDYRENETDNAHDIMFRRIRGHDLLTFYLRIGFLP